MGLWKASLVVCQVSDNFTRFHGGLEFSQKWKTACSLTAKGIFTVVDKLSCFSHPLYKIFILTTSSNANFGTSLYVRHT